MISSMALIPRYPAKNPVEILQILAKNSASPKFAISKSDGALNTKFGSLSCKIAS